MIKVLMVLLDRVAHVAVHDLHVENVIEQFEPLGAETLHQFDTPRRVVALVVFVAALAVEQFHAERDLELFGQRQDAFQTQRAILQALGVIQAVAVAGEADQPLIAGVGRLLEPLLVGLHQLVVMLDAVPRLANAAQAINDRIENHRANEAMLPGRLKLRRVEQVNPDETHLLAGFAQIIERNFPVTPAARAVIDAALEFDRRGFLGAGGLRQ